MDLTLLRRDANKIVTFTSFHLLCLVDNYGGFFFKKEKNQSSCSLWIDSVFGI